MPWYRIIDRFALVLSFLWAGYFLVIGLPATAIAMFGFWVVVRASILIADVFYTFIAGSTLVRVAQRHLVSGESTQSDWEEAKNAEYQRPFISFDPSRVGSNFGNLFSKRKDTATGDLDRFKVYFDREESNNR